MNDSERRKLFSKNLLDVLDKKDKTQIEVANAIGVSQQTFNTWCRGVALPRMGKIQLLADYFGVDMSELISDTPKVPEYSPDLLPLIEMYSDLTEQKKEMLMNYIKFLHNEQ